MTYPEEPGFKEGETSKDAAEAIAGRANQLRVQALEVIRCRPSTADEVAAALNMSVLAVRPRISELRTMELIRASGERRLNRSGQWAHVWITSMSKEVVNSRRFKIGNIDLAQIECRVLNTLAGQWDVVEKFRNHVDIYSENAAEFYGRPVSKKTPAERGTGKQIELSCGYGAGGFTIVRTARAGTYGPPVYLTDEQGTAARDLYRAKHPFVKALWEKASIMLHQLHQGASTPWGPPGQSEPCLQVHDHRIFHVASGLWIDYSSLEYRTLEGGDKIWIHRVRDGWRKTYGARLVQNVVELLARQVIAGAMVRVAAMGYRIPLTVHDNIYTVIPVNAGDPAEQLEAIRLEVQRPVPWLERCPIEAEAELLDALA